MEKILPQSPRKSYYLVYQTWDLFDLGCKSRSLTLGTTNKQEVNDVVHPIKNNFKKVLIDGFIIF